MTRPGVGDDRGAGGILVLAVVAVLGVTGLAGVSVTRALTVRHEVAAAADLAALAAAQSECGAAERVAAANAVELTACVVEGGAVRVEVARPVSWAGVVTVVRSTARAGSSCAARPDPERPDYAE